MEDKIQRGKTSVRRSRRVEDARHVDDLLDSGLEATFPASDPLSSLSTSRDIAHPTGRHDNQSDRTNLAVRLASPLLAEIPMLTLNKSVVMGTALLAGAAMAANAQQGSVDYDGSYAGSMVLSADPLPNGDSYPACVYNRPVSMQIVHGIVTVSYADWGRNAIHYRGRVDAAGDIQAWHTNGNATRSILTGRIQQAMFTGDLDRDRHRCPYSVVMSVGASAGARPR